MLWIFLSLSNALLDATNNLLNKKALNAKAPVSLTVFITRVISLPFLGVILWLGDLFPREFPSMTFWQLVGISALLRWYNLWAYTTALKLSEISLTVPLLNLTPAFMLITSPFFLGEFPSDLGLFAILMIIPGSYILNMRSDSKGFWKPFKNIAKDKGALLMLSVAFSASITANIDKMGIRKSNVIFWSIVLNAIVSLEFLLLYFRHPEPISRRNIRILLLSGLIKTFSLLAFRYALMMTLAVYVISVKRISSLFTVLFGAFFLKEKNIKYKVFGALMLIIAVIILGWISRN